MRVRVRGLKQDRMGLESCSGFKCHSANESNTLMDGLAFDSVAVSFMETESPTPSLLFT